MPRLLSGTHSPRHPPPLSSTPPPPSPTSTPGLNPDDPATQSDSERDAIYIRRRRMPHHTADDRTSAPPSPPPTRSPPSSFFFPFQAYPGNPDPGTTIPGISPRRFSASFDYPTSVDLGRPYAPFMAEGSSSSNSLFRNSAASNMMSNEPAAANIPRTASSHSFRAPFLSPASRPSSSLWSPPNYNHQLISLHNDGTSSPNGSSVVLPLKSRPPLPSTRLHQKLDEADKPWLQKPDREGRLSWWITFLCMILGIAAAAGLCYFGLTEVKKLDDSQLCLVLDDNFNGNSLDESVWSRDVELGGFGNGEFQMTTDSPDNLYLSNSQLYFRPTLTTQDLPNLDIFNGGNYTLSGCTTRNRTACSVRSNSATGAVINPVRSARINTKGKKSIKYGKVEIRAKLPKGDWLWPAIWMLPEQNTYGAWPASGEIDILEARGNGPSYKAQGSNFVRSSLNYGPMPVLFRQIFGWTSMKRSSFDQRFHTYVLEWDETFMRFYVDTRVTATLELELTGKRDGFWERGSFPLTAQNGSAQVVVENPYQGREKNAPFDQPFYLIINLSAGGTSGWFPDQVGSKSWYDGSLTAMRDFARAQNTWSATWPKNPDDLSFRIDYVKMWEKC